MTQKNSTDTISSDTKLAIYDTVDAAVSRKLNIYGIAVGVIGAIFAIVVALGAWTLSEKSETLDEKIKSIETTLNEIETGVEDIKEDFEGKSERIKALEPKITQAEKIVDELIRANGSLADETAVANAIKLLESIQKNIDASNIIGQIKDEYGAPLKISLGSIEVVDVDINYGRNQIHLKINTESAEMDTTPMYLASIRGGSNHGCIFGLSNIYNPRPDSFEVYINNETVSCRASKLSLKEQAIRGNWTIDWMAIGK